MYTCADYCTRRSRVFSDRTLHALRSTINYNLCSNCKRVCESRSEQNSVFTFGCFLGKQFFLRQCSLNGTVTGYVSRCVAGWLIATLLIRKKVQIVRISTSVEFWYVKQDYWSQWLLTAKAKLILTWCNLLNLVNLSTAVHSHSQQLINRPHPRNTWEAACGSQIMPQSSINEYCTQYTYYIVYKHKKHVLWRTTEMETACCNEERAWLD